MRENDSNSNNLMLDQEIENRILAFQGQEVLDLSGIAIKKISTSLKYRIEAEFPQLLELKLNFCDLETLDNFPEICTIVRVEVDENSLKTEEFAQLAHLSTSLISISLYKNPIEKLSLIPIFESFEKLEQIRLSSLNDSESTTDYDPIIASKFFLNIQSLIVYNNRDRNGEDFELNDNNSIALSNTFDLELGLEDDIFENSDDELSLGKRIIHETSNQKEYYDFHDEFFDIKENVKKVFKQIKL